MILTVLCYRRTASRESVAAVAQRRPKEPFPGRSAEKMEMVEQ